MPKPKAWQASGSGYVRGYGGFAVLGVSAGVGFGIQFHTVGAGFGGMFCLFGIRVQENGHADPVLFELARDFAQQVAEFDAAPEPLFEVSTCGGSGTGVPARVLRRIPFQ